ncbi:MAG: S41 family peptidase [Phycisphaerales bacterium JB054]
MHPVYRSRPPFSRWLALALGTLPLAAAYSQPDSQPGVVRAGFEQGLDGWTIGEVSGVTPDAYLVTRTSDDVWAGRHAVRFASTSANPGYQTAWTELPVVIEDGLPRVAKLRVQARTEHANELPAIWLRVDGPDGMLAVQTSFTPSPAAATWHSREMSIAVPPSAHTVLVGVGLVGAGRADFDEVEAALHDPADLPPLTAVAAEFLDHALDRMQAAALHRAVLDWEHIRASAHHLARGGAVPADTHAAIGYALAQLQDGHSSFIPASARQDSNRFSPWSGVPSGRSLPSGVRVIEVPALTSGTPEENLEYATHLRTLLESAAAAPGLVIDLRNNTGGNMWPMLAGVAPLLGQRTVGAFVQPEGPRTPWFVTASEAGYADVASITLPASSPDPSLASLPVAVLIGRRTASAGEAVLCAFLGRDALRTFGQPTAGQSTANASIELDDGSLLLLTTGVYADRTGTLYGDSIHPDQVVESAESAEPDAALAAAEAWLLGRNPD